jgi:hypothetical protein
MRRMSIVVLSGLILFIADRAALRAVSHRGRRQRGQRGDLRRMWRTERPDGCDVPRLSEASLAFLPSMRRAARAGTSFLRELWAGASGLLRRVRSTGRGGARDRGAKVAALRRRRQHRGDHRRRDLHPRRLAAGVPARCLGMEGLARRQRVVPRHVGVRKEQMNIPLHCSNR